ncbi:MAG: hypothetical protein J0H74_28210 [Chitinophagaceae bacterium]|nr:hypothetical protein [Chitinophagaceae bacterium]
MIVYLLKNILSSAIFLLAYRLLLEKEKMLVFNRGYLLFSLVMSFIIPLMTMPVRVPVSQAVEAGYMPRMFFVNDLQGPGVFAESRGVVWVYTLLFLYGGVTFYLLARCVKHFVALMFKKRKGLSFSYGGGVIVLTEERVVTHSFLKYIFIERGSYEKGLVEEEVLCHELAHVRQRHSLDILFLEILLVFCWFNPLLYLYRKDLRLVHEYLADDVVLDKYPDIPAYQYLLLDKMRRPPAMSSGFIYSMTKKRFIMMTKRTSYSTAVLRTATLTPFLAASLFLFAKRTEAQAPVKPPVTVLPKVRKTGQERPKIVYIQLNKPLPRIVPTPAQLKDWENGDVYGVWIDEKKVSNQQLQDFKNTDFAQVFISRLCKNAINYKNYRYQVDLMTRDYYEKYYQETINSHLMIKGVRQ